MSKNVQQLVVELPEVYQTIYGHPEWAQAASRDCYDRIDTLGAIYDQLAAKLGRPLRVLDLGCAQGFFCLSLAERGATVKGVDFQEENIAVCRALADENPQLDASFATGRIEEVINALEPGQYDLAIGLSVFHHIVHLHGVARTQRWLARLASCTEAMILELALRGEPLYWGPSQPADPRELLRDCAFFHEIARFNTHLSAIYRPLYVVSQHWLLLEGHCEVIEQWRDAPYTEAQEVHHGSRRYYFGKNYFCKVINFNLADGSLLEAENQRNQDELRRECAFLSAPPSGFVAPALLGHGISDSEGWLITERLEGELLRDRLLREDGLDKARIIGELLEQLTLLEQAGLYHDDLRSWNVLINHKDEVRLIDYGSIGAEKTDCVWPYDLFQSWFIFVNELFNLPATKLDLLRPFALSPFNVPEPFRHWLFAAWRQPAQTLTFVKLQALFAQREQLPACAENETGMERWVAAMESGLQQLQLHVHHLPGDSVAPPPSSDFGAPFEDLLRRTERLEQQMAEQLERQRDSDDRLAAVLSSRSWRLMPPYRYAGLQYHLLRQHGVKGRARHAAKRALRAGYAQIHRRPALKSWVINTLHKSGYYPQARQLFQRLFPLSHSVEEGMQQATHDAQRARLSAQLNEMDSVPEEVRNIYQQLKK
ncbi:methyltransferase domain-containing protein [Candidatus Sodalis pierantonius]|uniref:methyltransferase domain-containing protein n=1 Tax=Candidatus Sodalis pierantonii TaxID=1486991 RepID=UPI00046CB32C|nr:methyltransferase domain-containing protein [Candidatus Sodalis pierantonius]